MEVSTNLSNQLEAYLNLSSAELKVTAGNMANVDTPNYKTQGFDFQAEVEAAIRDERKLAVLTDHSSSVPKIGDVDHLLSRPDGNNVSMDREGLKMTEAQLKFHVGVELMKHEYARLSNAIHSDTK